MSRKKAVVKMINTGDEISKAVARMMEDRCNKDVRTAKVEGRTKKNLDEDNMVKLEASMNGKSLATMIKNKTIKRNWMWKTVNVQSGLKIYKWNLHGGKTTMLYLNLSGHDIFKKEVWHLTGKTLPNSNALPPFSRKLTKLT